MIGPNDADKILVAHVQTKSDEMAQKVEWPSIFSALGKRPSLGEVYYVFINLHLLQNIYIRVVTFCAVIKKVWRLRRLRYQSDFKSIS